MDAAFYVFLLLAGSIVGFFSGLLGIGGGILMFPLLLYDRGKEYYGADDDAGIFRLPVRNVLLS